MGKKKISVKIGFVLSGILMTVAANATVVEFQTNFGDFDVELFDDEMPITVENFLTYVDAGDYDNTVLHRLIEDFILQGGGYTFEDTGPFQAIAERPAIIHEHELANLTGTISMARVGADLDSAVSQWFFNLTDNTFLDADGASYAAFGQVLEGGMDVVNVIGGLNDRSYSGSAGTPSFANLPVHDFVSGTITEDHVVYVHSITRKIASSNSSSVDSFSSESSSSVSSSVSSSSEISASSESSSLSVSSVSSESSSSSVSVSSESSSSVNSQNQAVSSATASSGGGGGSLGYFSLIFLIVFGVRNTKW